MIVAGTKERSEGSNSGWGCEHLGRWETVVQLGGKVKQGRFGERSVWL